MSFHSGQTILKLAWNDSRRNVYFRLALLNISEVGPALFGSVVVEQKVIEDVGGQCVVLNCWPNQAFALRHKIVNHNGDYVLRLDAVMTIIGCDVIFPTLANGTMLSREQLNHRSQDEEVGILRRHDERMSNLNVLSHLNAAESACVELFVTITERNQTVASRKTPHITSSDVGNKKKTHQSAKPTNTGVVCNQVVKSGEDNTEAQTQSACLVTVQRVQKLKKIALNLALAGRPQDSWRVLTTAIDTMQTTLKLKTSSPPDSSALGLDRLVITILCDLYVNRGIVACLMSDGMSARHDANLCLHLRPGCVKCLLVSAWSYLTLEMYCDAATTCATALQQPAMTRSDAVGGLSWCTHDFAVPSQQKNTVILGLMSIRQACNGVIQYRMFAWNNASESTVTSDSAMTAPAQSLERITGTRTDQGDCTDSEELCEDTTSGEHDHHHHCQAACACASCDSSAVAVSAAVIKKKTRRPKKSHKKKLLSTDTDIHQPKQTCAVTVTTCDSAALESQSCGDAPRTPLTCVCAPSFALNALAPEFVPGQSVAHHADSGTECDMTITRDRERSRGLSVGSNMTTGDDYDTYNSFGFPCECEENYYDCNWQTNEDFDSCATSQSSPMSSSTSTCSSPAGTWRGDNDSSAGAEGWVEDEDDSCQNYHWQGFDFSQLQQLPTQQPLFCNEIPFEFASCYVPQPVFEYDSDYNYEQQQQAVAMSYLTPAAWCATRVIHSHQSWPIDQCYHNIAPMSYCSHMWTWPVDGDCDSGDNDWWTSEEDVQFGRGQDQTVSDQLTWSYEHSETVY